MIDTKNTQEGGVNPSTEKTSTQKWLEDWISSASTEDQSKTKKWLESWVNNSSHNNPTKKWLKDWIAPVK